ncbi:hypothetical protein LPJ53_005575 [Coemansia erecta]|uniref:Uncharacterized protein n=1 Tax=Coemansia erecta TaxID=147472 RepID=A0A9W7XS67_9FUNG|nr:hypothetical protein LPJ53_005575 [Coemansia erecta]
MNVNEELLCSFEILKPLTENLQSCMARVEANFWSRRQQVEAMMNEAIMNEAKKNIAPEGDATGAGAAGGEAEAKGEVPPVGAPSSTSAAASSAAAAASTNPVSVPIPMPTGERKRRSPAVAKSPGRFDLEPLSDANSDDDDDDEDDSSSTTGIENADSPAVLHGTPPRGTSKLKQTMVQGRSSSSSSS